MSKLADRCSPETSPGMTSSLDPPPALPSAAAARDFYLHGTGSATAGIWYQSKQQHLGWTFNPPPETFRLSALFGLVAQKLRRLRLLRVGWDGGSALPVTEVAIYGAAGLLDRILDADSELPQVFPLPDGGVQIEWYAAGNEIDIDVDSSGMAHILATTSTGKTLIEGSTDPREASQLLDDLSKHVRKFSEWVNEERQRG